MTSDITPPSDTLLSGRTSLVTGADTEFARALALGLADAGASVALVGSGALARATVDEIEGTGRRAVALDEDLASRASAERAFQRAAEALGRIDALVHAHVEPAAVVSQVLVETSEPDWDTRCELGLRRTLFCFQAAFAHMQAAGGRIVLVAPTASMIGTAGLVPWSASIEAQRALAKSAAKQWGPLGITVNCIAPAVEQFAPGTDVAPTSLGDPPLKDGGVRHDVGPVVAFLASPVSHHLTAATLRVDGGVWTAG